MHCLLTELHCFVVGGGGFYLFIFCRQKLFYNNPLATPLHFLSSILPWKIFVSASIEIPNHTERILWFLQSNILQLKSYTNHARMILRDILNWKVRKFLYGHYELILHFLASSFKYFNFICDFVPLKHYQKIEIRLCIY